MNTQKLKLIGKGMFSKVYLKDEKTVLINSVCYMKECMANWVDSIWFPKLEREDYQQYTCEYFPKVKSLKSALSKEHYEIYLQLRSIFNIFDKPRNKYDLLDYWRGKFATISNDSIREDLLYFLAEASNYGSDIDFEISPRNVAVKNGNLILLDCFFVRSQLDTIRAKGIKSYQY